MGLYKNKRIRDMLISTIAILFACYLGVALILYYKQPGLLYQPTKEVAYSPDDIGLEYVKVNLQTDDDIELFGWFVPFSSC